MIQSTRRSEASCASMLVWPSSKAVCTPSASTGAHFLFEEVLVASCTGCGQAIQEGARFCASCGAALPGGQQASSAPGAPAVAPVTRVVVVEPKRGGRLAFKGFLLSFVMAMMFAMALKGSDDKATEAVGTVIAFGVGTAYIVTNLRKWKRQNDVVRGAGVGWTVAAFLVIVCVGGLLRVGGNATRETGSLGSPSATRVDPKAVLLRDVKLDFKWSKGGFDNVMVTDFTLHNPTQYSFKDFEIKCTHSAPSGTVIDSNTRTVYEVVGSKSTKVIRQMNMGFIHSQASRSACEITDLTPVP